MTSRTDLYHQWGISAMMTPRGRGQSQDGDTDGEELEVDVVGSSAEPTHVPPCAIVGKNRFETQVNQPKNASEAQTRSCCAIVGRRA